ncbi:hypothetical protein C9374_011934 [Naegleria lovaniensis]|uniref:Uncharacterized protein n=1 Tax=Naegleria lovaniensis TaxID=51637 RepID=A0AA88GDX2_NAELO|nr:uncharacterized protein C9374_011934 [Naegleria lovaniensis]KAG2373645.1 hypothetical protein C9374_011934 [Naegleria lovaniensis]
MERDEEETTSASQQATSSRQFITHDELLNQQRKMTLYETVEYYLLYSDYRVDQQVKELNAIEQTLMRVQQQESSQENSSSQLRNNENNRSLKSLSVGSSIPKQLKRVRKLKTFMNEYGTVCRDFLSRIKQNHSLGEINIDASLKVVNGRRNNSSTALSNRKDSMADNLVENRLELLHSAFHTKCVHNHLLPFIRKSLLLKAKQNIERDKLYGNVHSTEELLLLYQLKHGNNER